MAESATLAAPTPLEVDALVREISARLNGTFGAGAAGEARELLAALLDEPRHWPVLHSGECVDSATVARALDAAERRARGAPLAYAAGRANFRALTLEVDGRVLIPRPETELLLDLVLERVSEGVAVDAGTGSGAIAIALATEGKFDRVIATDISRDALEVARANGARYPAARVEFVEGNLLVPAAAMVGSEGAAVVVSNPPYISHAEASALPRSVRDWEPAIALYSGGDGLETTARLVRQARSVLRPGGLLALEADERRASLVAELVGRDPRFEDVTVRLDMAGRERFVLARRRPERAEAMDA